MAAAPASPRWRASAESSCARSRASVAASWAELAPTSAARKRATSARDCRRASRRPTSSDWNRARSVASRALFRWTQPNATSVAASRTINSLVVRRRWSVWRATSAAIRTAVLVRRAAGYAARGEDARSAAWRTASDTASPPGSPASTRNSTRGPPRARPGRGLRRTAALVHGDGLGAGLGVDEGIHLVPDLGAHFRRAQPFTVEARQDHGDVVGPAALVREPDQPVARGLQVALARGELGHLFLLY